MIIMYVYVDYNDVSVFVLFRVSGEGSQFFHIQLIRDHSENERPEHRMSPSGALMHTLTHTFTHNA